METQTMEKTSVEEAIKVLRVISSRLMDYQLFGYLNKMDIPYEGSENTAEVYMLYYQARQKDGLEYVDDDDFGQEDEEYEN
jgi:hypothetical protein